MKKEQSISLALTEHEQLLFNNLSIRKFWSEQDSDKESAIDKSADSKVLGIPHAWDLTRGITLHAWQEECVGKWFEQRQGTVKVVTGAGKTILALAIAERMHLKNPELRVAIVVPTIVLQNQWYQAIVENSNLPRSMVGRLGGGYNDSFEGDIRILLCVLKSAAERLPRLVNKAGVGDSLLLIADECHRVGAPEMSRLFATKRAYSLGLSATPEREDYWNQSVDDEEDNQYNLSLLGRELGPIVYSMTVHEAFEQGILPEFEIHHYGLLLNDEERQGYDALSRRLRDANAELREVGHQFGIHDQNITQRLQGLAKREDRLGVVARRCVFLSRDRKRLLYDAATRLEAVQWILKKEFAEDPGVRAILFHESIESVMAIYHSLLDDFPVSVEHSQLPENLRANSISLFRRGLAQVLVSARSLIEGFNVPDTDIGIIVASSTSVRQRIQTIGRLLRKGKKRDKAAIVYVLYVRNSVDEAIYEKVNWNKVLGAKRNRYFIWTKDEGAIEESQAPRMPLPDESSICPETLAVGDEYPGAYEGVEYSCDSDGNIFDANRQLVKNPQHISDNIRRVKGADGRFRVTERNRYVLVLVPRDDGWVVKFAGQLAEPFVLQTEPKCGFEAVSSRQFNLGDIYPDELVGPKPVALHYKQSRGNFVLARKESKGERYARIGNDASDPIKGQDALGLLKACADLKRIYPQFSKLLLTEANDAVYLKDGQYLYLYSLDSGLEF